MKIVLSILFVLLLAGVVLVIVTEKGDSGRKIAWLLIVSFLPVAGIILYLLFGLNFRKKWIYKRRYKKYEEILEANMTPELRELLFDNKALDRVREDFRPLASMMYRAALMPVTEGNDIEIMTNGQRKFNMLMRDLERAEHSIHIEYFHFGTDSGGKAIRDMLMKKAAEGVEVRFLHENIADFHLFPFYHGAMKKAGVEVRKFTNPYSHLINFFTLLNYRNHRKIVVIDGKVGYTGGMNANNHYFLTWRDTHMRITGKSVASLQFIFLSSWLTCKGTLSSPLLSYFPQLGLSGAEAAALDLSTVPVPRAEEEILKLTKGSVPVVSTADALAGKADLSLRNEILHSKLLQIVPDETDTTWPVLQMSYEWAILHAKKYIWIQSPYFVPPESVLNALKTAALSGVDVRIMTPENVDTIFLTTCNASYFEECLQAGVKIYLRGGKFNHSKTFVCDDYLSSIGTANLDFRSFDLSHEDNGYIYDEETALLMKAIYEKDFELCRQLTLEEWSEQPFHKRFAQSFIRLFAPML